MTEFENLWIKHADEIGKLVENYWKEKEKQNEVVKKLFFQTTKIKNKRNRMMTNSQKHLCRDYARNSNFSAKEISVLVGCCVATARSYIKIFRKTA